MKAFILLILFAFPLPAFNQDLPDSVYARIKILLDKNSARPLSAPETREIKNLTYLIQNRGFGLQERLRDYKDALVYTDRALAIWTELKDTANEANLLKYRGLLLGNLGDFAQAKKEISKAIELFGKKKMDFGIAVSEFDLSRVFALENKPDSALYYANDSKEFWKIKENSDRIFTINNRLMNLYYVSNDLKKAKDVQEESQALLKESQTLLKNEKMEGLNLLDFYLLSERIYKKLASVELADNYRALYGIEIEDLKTGGRSIPKSDYE